MLSQTNPIEGLDVDDQQFAGIVAAIHSFRRTWSLPEIRKIVLLLLHEKKDPADITSAGIRAAGDKRVQAPQAILWDEFWTKPKADKPEQPASQQADHNWQRQNRSAWAACDTCDEWGYVWSDDKIQIRCNHTPAPADDTSQVHEHVSTAKAQIRITRFREAIGQIARSKSVDGEKPWLPADLEQQVALRQQEAEQVALRQAPHD